MEPTEWMNQMAIVRKDNGNLRLGLYPKSIIKVFVREKYKLSTFEDILPELSNAKS